MGEDVPELVVVHLAEMLRKEYGVLRLKHGVLIAVEGVDGSGTTTHSRILAGVMAGVVEAPVVIWTGEPTGGPVGGYIHGLLRGGRRVDPGVLAVLFAADRVYHLYLHDSEGIIGVLRRGGLVVMRRYVHSSLAYQAEAGLPLVLLLNALAPPPHVLVYLDPGLDTAMERLSQREERTIMEERSTLEKVYNTYRSLLDKRWCELVEEAARSLTGKPCNRLLGLLRDLATSWARMPGLKELYHGDPCGWPRGVITVDTSQPLEEVAYTVATGVLDVLLRAGLAEKKEQ